MAAKLHSIPPPAFSIGYFYISITQVTREGTRDMQKMIAQLLHEREQHRDCVLVSLIADAGSAPRGKGSLMLVGAEGRILGTIGGGAVEKRSEEMALALLAEKRSGEHDFILRTNRTEDIGMACGGDVTAHFQYIPAESTLWQTILTAAADRMKTQTGGWLILREDGGAPTLACGGHAAVGDMLSSTLLDRLCSKSCVRADGYFSLPLPIGNRAIIFGAGHVAQSLCPLLRSVDFRPVVFDSRPELASAALFPDAEAIICGDFTRISDYLTLTAEDYLVVMTHGHVHDMEVEEQALRGQFAYLGVIGSRRKIAAVNARLLERGIQPARLNDVHTPIGTAIKAVTPAEIAVSIAGEMILVRATAREAGGTEKHSCPMH